MTSQMTLLDEGEVFVTVLDGGRPAFWQVRWGRPVMLSYALTAADLDPEEASDA